MTYSTPELLFINSAQHLVLDEDSLPELYCCDLDDVVHPYSRCDESW
jgi:hypothetical protein